MLWIGCSDALAHAPGLRRSLNASAFEKVQGLPWPDGSFWLTSMVSVQDFMRLEIFE